MNGKTKGRLRAAAQITLGGFLLTAGTGHMTFAREEFQAQVPDWVPLLDKDTVVLLSGVVEPAFGTALVSTWKQPRRAVVGAAAAALFVAVFPGNVAQLTGHRDAFGLDTDTKRAARRLGAGRHRRTPRAHPLTSDPSKPLGVLHESIEP